MSNTKNDIPYGVVYQLCRNNCDKYYSCSEHYKRDCENMLSLYSQCNAENPEHYKHGAFELVDEMIIMFGIEKTIIFCQLNAWKYRSRAPYKNQLEDDMKKADCYLEMAHELQQIMIQYPKSERDDICELLKRKNGV